MTRRLRLLAPAKVNWTLEVLHRRDDGYHEIRSVMQTIDLCDTVTLVPGDGVHLQLRGDAQLLAGEPVESNLAYRATLALQAHERSTAGVRIELEKRIPIAAGLGGGSSDAAAVLRGCNALWDLQLDDDTLIEIAASIGSDVPFFIAGGCAVVCGRGEQVRALPDATAPTILLATPPPSARGEKTASMYAALTSRDFTEGEATSELAETIIANRTIDDGQLTNVFERLLRSTQPQTEVAMAALRAEGASPHLAGSGPSFFVLLNAGSDAAAVTRRCQELGFESRLVSVMSRAASQHIEEA